ncbi:SDR family oxidoreductase [Gillisia sp. M10.2A]|uniref:SDR family oxidoreductase n=1 Tax=Gillisia lutea TaxID=2909668 RepID=A0ABS9EK87_9FLAO|nr:SDR family oxidoreductase [Gillisia lutea]MCF4102225.1 SDR family oxidoreductase [Gillisia lutea]
MKNIIVTGASRGIGLEMIRLFSKAGHNVLALSRNINGIESLKLPKVKAVSFDITSDEDLENISIILKDWGKVDILVNNAGAIVNKPFMELSVDDFKKVYNTNVFGVAALIQKVVPCMDATGHVVNISSMGGVVGSMKFPGLAAYSSSKGALITLTEMLAEEFKEKGPSFNVLALGAVQTEMLEEAFPGYKAPLSAFEMAEYIVEFSLTGNKYYNGKLLQVSNSTP